MTWDTTTLITAGTSVLVTLITGIFGVLMGLANGRRESEHREAEREDRRIDQTLEAIENHRMWAEGSFKRMQVRIETLEGEVSNWRGKASRLEGANSALARYIHVILDWVESVVPDSHPPQPPDEIRQYLRS
ncbi:hypothetical protein ACFORJ_01805 [Corynebacterium hansenii]|uniref:Secreted protein n=1 Tax=Corynebacterium hansenii TaxID=394964 RepID=A0ABV7ZKW3_9CORY|nr:hypothetical protein [Corynebacterium hansenii]WJY99266.1 hypothetical protein CHAN_03190 [Corynebacterium hansenii]